MPLYFFETVKDGQSFRGENALDLESMTAAWEEATVAAGELIRDLDGSLKPGTHWSIIIEDEKHKKLRTLTVSAEAHD